MTVVVDASVACKWFVEEAGAAEADGLLVSGRNLVAPDLVIPEVCNALWRKSEAGEMGDAQATVAVDELPRFFDDLVPAVGLAARAFAIAKALRHPVYDCLYVALAERLGAHVVTADAKLIERLFRTDWSRFVVDLRNADAVLGQG